HFPGQFHIVPETAVGIPRESVESLANPIRGNMIPLIAGVFVKTNYNVTGHDIIETVELYTAGEIPFFIDEPVNRPLDEVPEFWIAGISRDHFKAVEGISCHVSPLRQ